MTDIAGLIRDAKLPEKTVSICLRPDLVAEYENVERQQVDARKGTGDSLAGTRGGEFTAQLTVLRDEMASSTVPFVFRALPRATFRALASQHPPRQNADGSIHSDDAAGVNDSTFPEALVRACLAEPELDDGLWTDLCAKLTDRQFQIMVDAAWRLNRSEVNVPFLPSASTPTPTFEPK